MNCPFCNNPPIEHSLYPEPEEYRVSKLVCYLTVLEAQHAAQRAAAIAHLKALGAERKSWRGNIPSHVEIRRECDIEIAAAIAAYRAVGILRETRK